MFRSIWLPPSREAIGPPPFKYPDVCKYKKRCHRFCQFDPPPPTCPYAILHSFNCILRHFKWMDFFKLHSISIKRPLFSLTVLGSFNSSVCSSVSLLCFLKQLCLCLCFTSQPHNYSVMLARFPVFLDWTSTTQRIKCLVSAQHISLVSSERATLCPTSNTLQTEPLQAVNVRSENFYIYSYWYGIQNFFDNWLKCT